MSLSLGAGLRAGLRASTRTILLPRYLSTSSRRCNDATEAGKRAAHEAAERAAPEVAAQASQAAQATKGVDHSAKHPEEAIADAAYAHAVRKTAKAAAVEATKAAGGSQVSAQVVGERTAEDVAALLAINKKRIPQQSHTLANFHRIARQRAIELYHMTANFHPTTLPAHVVKNHPAVQGQEFETEHEKHRAALQADLDQRIIQALAVQTPTGGVDPRGGAIRETRDPRQPAYVQEMAPPKFYNAGQLLRQHKQSLRQTGQPDEGSAWNHNDEVSQEIMSAIAQGAAPAEALDKDVQTYLSRAHFRDPVTPKEQRPKVGKSRTLKSLVDRREARVRDALFGTIGGALPGESLLLAREGQRKALQRQRKLAREPPAPQVE